MNRRILYPVLFLLLLAAVSPARGQRFEWATGYSGWDGCEVRGAVTDSRGNVYMIGMFTFGASWVDGEDLYPAGMARTSDGFYTVIAKVSPEGDLVWKRIIATSDGVDQPFGIKMLGDSSLICLVSIGFPGYLHQQIYYLDTIVEVTDMYDTDIDYPVSPNYEGFGSPRTMGFITLDLDGNLREHILSTRPILTPTAMNIGGIIIEPVMGLHRTLCLLMSTTAAMYIYAKGLAMYVM